MGRVVIKMIEESNELSGFWGGDLYDVVLERDDEAIQATGIAYLDISEDDQEELHELFEEWYEMAENGEDGFEFL